MLIIVACFVVALLAFLGGLWLAYIENQEMLAQASAQTIVAPVEKTFVPALEQELLKEPMARGPRNRMSSGQLIEMAIELRSLQARAGEINERLRLLSVMVEDQLEQIAVGPIGDREELAV
jgi:hypothetical protein